MNGFEWMGPAGWMGLGLACGAVATAFSLQAAFNDLMRRLHGKASQLTRERDRVAAAYSRLERELLIKDDQILQLREDVNAAWLDYERLLDDPAEYARQHEAHLALYAEGADMTAADLGVGDPLHVEIAPVDFDPRTN